MGGSVQVQNQFSHDNIDMNANHQSKHQPEPKIVTENPKGPESEGLDGGDTSINVPGDNVETDVISPQEGASDDKIDEPPVLPSNLPLSGKLLVYQQFMDSKKKRQREKEKRKRKRNKRKKKKRDQGKLLPCKEKGWKFAI
jgi:hypothetical protein